ncbi:MAG: hypothetical protein KIS66_07140 [Fimbriimonadaceae bacterium]|nr:hypothetical protein [Fimbriimonadaceae bacterium]
MPNPPQRKARRALGAEHDLDALIRAAAFPRIPLDTCPHCHARLEDVRRDEMLGCPLCYAVFEAEVQRILA